jgi:4'-phosphopantetheinyl transferase
VALSEDTTPDLSGLTAGDAHLWLFPEAASDVEQLEDAASATLSSQETARHASISHPVRAKQFLHSRMLLRGVLAQYLDISPQSVLLTENPNGKPYLFENSPSLSFNLSHSNSAIILAVSTHPAIGIDLENLDRAESAYRISRHFFSPEEQQFLDSMGPERHKFALSLWTLKESIVKAQGDTIWQGLNKNYLRIEDSLISVIELPSPNSPNWKLASGLFLENYMLSLAIRGNWTLPHKKLRLPIYCYGQTVSERAAFTPELVSRNPKF